MPVAWPLKNDKNGKNVAVQLRKPHPMQGVVLDASGNPVAGARVRVWRLGDVQGEPSQDTDRDPTPPVPFWPAADVTKEDGRFAFPAVGEVDEAILEVVHPKFARVDLPWRSPAGQTPQGFRVRLLQPKEVIGRVIDPNGKPVAGARIAFPTRVVIGTSQSRTCVTVQSAADGTFHLRPHRTELLDIMVHPPAGSGLAPYSDTLSLDGVERITVEIALKPAKPAPGR
jgi:hypothetical protein